MSYQKQYAESVNPWSVPVFPWSSAGAHCGVQGDPSAMLTLGEWFGHMPAEQWKAALAAMSESSGEVDRLRIHTRTGRPLGGDAFLSKVETLLGRRLRPLPVGRPKGWRKKKTIETGRPMKGK